MSHAPSREKTAWPMISGRYLTGAFQAVTSPGPGSSRCAAASPALTRRSRSEGSQKDGTGTGNHVPEQQIEQQCRCTTSDDITRDIRNRRRSADRRDGFGRSRHRPGLSFNLRVQGSGA